jgi:hypothetical protein
MATPGQRPGTEVEQEFVTPAPILEDPALPPVIIGIAKQLETDLDAGTYDGSAFQEPYPDLTLNASVDLSTVVVKIQTTDGIFTLPDSVVNQAPAPPADEFKIEAGVRRSSSRRASSRATSSSSSRARWPLPRLPSAP